MFSMAFSRKIHVPNLNNWDYHCLTMMIILRCENRAEKGPLRFDHHEIEYVTSIVNIMP